MDTLVVRVANRHLIRLAVQQAWSKVRVASVPDLTPEVVVAFVEPFYLHYTKVAGFGDIARKVAKLLDLFRKAPRLWDAFKGALDLPADFDSLGVLEKGKALAAKLKEWAASGWNALKDVFHKIHEAFPISMFFVPKHKMPGLTDLMERLVTKVPWLAKAIAAAGRGIGHVDTWINKNLPTFKRPVLAAVFAWVWFNVAELTWDLPFLVRGFTGLLSLGELFASLPESGIGFIAAAFGLGFQALPVTLVARIVWLVANHYLEWVPGKGLKVRWDRLGVKDERTEIVPV